MAVTTPRFIGPPVPVDGPPLPVYGPPIPKKPVQISKGTAVETIGSGLKKIAGVAVVYVLLLGVSYTAAWQLAYAIEGVALLYLMLHGGASALTTVSNYISTNIGG